MAISTCQIDNTADFLMLDQPFDNADKPKEVNLKRKGANKVVPGKGFPKGDDPLVEFKKAVGISTEEGKTTYLAQQKTKHGDVSEAKAEKLVKASPEWSDYIKKMVNAKTAANRAKVELDYLKMRHMENTSAEANARSERKL